MISKMKTDRLPNETGQAYARYCIYRDMPPQYRNYTTVLEEINVNARRKIKLPTLYRMAETYNWKERVKLHDMQQQLEIMEKRKGIYFELSEKELKQATGLINYGNELLRELYECNNSLETKTRLFKMLTESLIKAHEFLCNLTGRPSEYKELNVNADVSENTVNLFDKIKQIREEDDK